eukprot:TRINITY_DN3011_c0_g1_i14.p1 TRINITY_DN3011_c0_g1~~TRINITY_DN3011_c0_g1_i14.p1  ORF type:complete len:1238 (+),score=210.98 TRINITY_DN3011_c0_g1_i14:106-3819(+)
MLRSLVGSEMCIRDSINAEYGDTKMGAWPVAGLLLLLLLLPLPRCSCNTEEVEALELLYNSTSGWLWLNNTGWVSGDSAPCPDSKHLSYNSTWFGVRCNGTAAVGIEVATNNLRGTIPGELSDLTRLQTLELYDNSLSGTVPNELSSLVDLSDLAVDNNSLSGTIPDNFGELAMLQHLYLDTNSLSGTIPTSLASLPLLQSLYLNSNSISGTIPTELSDLAQLRTLVLDTNLLSGTIPSQLASLTNLEMLYMFTNSLSGTLPSVVCSLPNLGSLGLSTNSLSGTVPSELSSPTGLQNLFGGANLFSGTIPDNFGELAMLQHLYLDTNSLSGTIPTSLASLPLLQSLYLNLNSISGTIPTEFSDLAQLRTLYMFANFLSGSLPNTLPNQLEYLSVNSNSISGTIPRNIDHLGQLRYLFLSSNLLSGSIPDEFARLNKLSFGGLANNHLSGHIPHNMSQLTELTRILLHNNLLSGTLPNDLAGNKAWVISVSDNRRLSGTLPWQLSSAPELRVFLGNGLSLSGTLPTFVSRHLQILALARNYLVGDLDSLQSSHGLRTLVLASNRFSCPAPTLDGATRLGIGVFRNPQTDARIHALTTSNQAIPAWLRLPIGSKKALNTTRTYENTVLVFAGNEALVDGSGLGQSAGRLLDQDQVRQGRQTLFSGYSSLKILAWLVLPGLVLMHIAAIVAVVRWEYGESLTEYLCRRLQRSHQTQSEVLQVAVRSMVGLAVCGIGIVALNLAAPNVYNPGYQDPLLRATITGVQVLPWYQWAWVSLNCATLFVILHLWERLSRRDFSHRAAVVLGRLHDFVLSGSAQLRAVHTWRNRLRRHKQRSPWRKAAYVFMHVPIFVVGSVPAFCYVLSRNVPNQGLWLTLLGDPAILVIFKLVWLKGLTPRVAIFLSRFRHAVDESMVIGPRLAVLIHKTQVTSAVLFELVVVVLAPVLFVVVLDESCLRYYLHFSHELSSLMEAWRINQRGWEAYRPGFCSRRLLSEFSYVWLIYTLAQAFVTPTSTLIKAHPLFTRARRAASSAELSERDETLKRARSSQRHLGRTMSFLVLVANFGPVVPLLLLLAPLVVWLQSCALDLFDRHPNKESRFSMVMASRWLVQVPVKRVLVLTLVATWVGTGCVFLDLGFDLSPMVLYSAFCVVVGGIFYQRSKVNSQVSFMMAKRQSCRPRGIELGIITEGSLAEPLLLPLGQFEAGCRDQVASSVNPTPHTPPQDSQLDHDKLATILQKWN